MWIQQYAATSSLVNVVSYKMAPSNIRFELRPLDFFLWFYVKSMVNAKTITLQ